MVAARCAAWLLFSLRHQQLRRDLMTPLAP
jgi:hypothetical protein